MYSELMNPSWIRGIIVYTAVQIKSDDSTPYFVGQEKI